MPSYTLYYFNGRGRAEVIRMMFGAAGVQFTDKRYEFNEWDKYRNEMPTYCMPVLEIDGKNRMPETMAISRYLAHEYGFYGKTNMDMFRIDYISDCLYEIMHDYMRYFHEKNGRFRYHTSSSMASNTKGNMASNTKGNVTSNTKATMASNMKGSATSSASSSMSSSLMSNMSSNQNSSMPSNMKSSMSSTPNSNMGSAMTSDGSFMQMRFMESCRRVLPFLERTLGMHCGGNQFFMGEQLMMCDMVLYCFLENPMMEFHSMFNSYPKLMALWKRVGTHPRIGAYLKTRINTKW